MNELSLVIYGNRISKGQGWPKKKNNGNSRGSIMKPLGTENPGGGGQTEKKTSWGYE